MIDLVICDLCAVLLAPELKVRLLLSQLDKDGITVYAYAALERSRMRRALRYKGYLEYFDGLLYTEIMPELTSLELLRLASSSTKWLRTPASIDYAVLLKELSPRRRLLPKMLRARPPDTLTSDVD